MPVWVLQVLQEKGELGEQVAAARMERNALLAAQRAGQGQGLPTTPSVANREQPLASDQRLELQWKAAWLTSSCALAGERADSDVEDAARYSQLAEPCVPSHTAS